jgi:predicted ArsR family transcriptional regulator
MDNHRDDALVMEVLQREVMPLMPSEVAKWAGITPGAARRAMQRLQAKGLVFRNRNGYCELVPTPPDAA